MTAGVDIATSPGGPADPTRRGPDRGARLRARARRADPRRLPGWAQALLAFAASRVLYTFVVLRCADLAPRHRDGTPWTYLQLANNWDGTWYQRVAEHGYPDRLPVDAAGHVVTNTWAFYPLYPKLVGLVQATGPGWEAAGTLVSLAAASLAMIVIRSVTAHVAGPRLALWTVALLSFFPSALVLQLPYSEALALLLIATVLWCLQRGRYLLAVPVIGLVGVARPVGVPLAAVLTVHLAVRVVRLRTAPGDRTARAAVRALAGPVLAWLAAVAAAVAWPVLAWWVTGVPDAYTRTMASWRSPQQIVWVRPWIDTSKLVLGEHLGPALLVTSLVALGWWLVRVGLRVVGPDLVAWCAAYTAYLVAVLDSFTSLPRYLLPLFPLGTLLASSSRSRAFRIAVTVAFGALGVIWLLVVWRSRHVAP